jgi:hypothetical protein
VKFAQSEQPPIPPQNTNRGGSARPATRGGTAVPPAGG